MFRLFCTHNGPLEGQSEVETGAIPLGKPAAERIRARGDRSARAQLATDRGEPARGPSPGKGARWCGWRASIPSCCSPLQHRSAKAQADCDLNPDASENGAGRTALLNAACSLAESYGERLRSCNVRDLNREKAEGMSPELAAALQPLFGAIALLTEASASTTRDRTAGRAELSRCVPAEAGQWSEKHPRSGYRF